MDFIEEWQKKKNGTAKPNWIELNWNQTKQKDKLTICFLLLGSLRITRYILYNNI